MKLQKFGGFLSTGFSKTKLITISVAKKLPTFAWGMWAMLGILMVGVLIGYLWGSDPESTTGPIAELREENQELINLIDGYEELSSIYFEQGKNVNIVTDLNLLGRDPERVAEAFSDMEYNRNRINVQLGRIYEMRENAGLDPSLPTEPLRAN